MAKEFRGVINLDARDSVPDWEPYLQPVAPEGAPNVLMIVWDDVGFGAMDLYGGPIETPNMKRIADMGIRYSEFSHDGALFTDALQPIDRPQCDHQWHGRHH